MKKKCLFLNFRWSHRLEMYFYYFYCFYEFYTNISVLSDSALGELIVDDMGLERPGTTMWDRFGYLEAYWAQ